MPTRRHLLAAAVALPLLRARRALAQPGIEVTSLGVTATGALLQGGELSPLELTEAYYQEHERLTLDPEARNHKHTYVTQDDDAGVWTIAQVLVDPEGLNDWQAIFTVDKNLARDEGKPTLNLISMDTIV